VAEIKWGMSVDGNQKELKNLRVHNVNGNPGTPVAGQVWYDTATGKIKYRDAVGAANVDPTARASHTGTQTASTISDFDTQVRTSRLDQMSVPTAAVSFNSQNITNLLDPSTAQMAATKNYVDTALVNATSGISYKAPVRAATTANGTLATAFANGQAIDGITLATGNRILLKNQTAPAENGIYTVNSSGAPTRAADANSAAELEGGVIVPVDEGTTQGNTMWMNTTDVVTLGTDPLTWIQFGAGSVYTGSLGVQLVGADFRANPGTGLTLSGNQLVPDFGTGANKVMRAKIAVGVVPSGSADAVVNHALAVADKSDVLVEVTENTTGIKVLVGVTCTDANNVTLSFETAPTSSQYRYQILGLS
jgi:hypothetical protein